MATKPLPWEDRAKRFLKAELARADVWIPRVGRADEKARDEGNRSIHRQQDQPGHVLSNVHAGGPHCNRRGDCQTGGYLTGRRSDVGLAQEMVAISSSFARS